MLTGDKQETATCIAKSSRLVSRTQELFIFNPVHTRTEAHQQLNAFRKKQDCALVITGDSLEVRLIIISLETKNLYVCVVYQFFSLFLRFVYNIIKQNYWMLLAVVQPLFVVDVLQPKKHKLSL